MSVVCCHIFCVIVKLSLLLLLLLLKRCKLFSLQRWRTATKQLWIDAYSVFYKSSMFIRFTYVTFTNSIIKNIFAKKTVVVLLSCFEGRETCLSTDVIWVLEFSSFFSFVLCLYNHKGRFRTIFTWDCKCTFFHCDVLVCCCWD